MPKGNASAYTSLTGHVGPTLPVGASNGVEHLGRAGCGGEKGKAEQRQSRTMKREKEGKGREKWRAEGEKKNQQKTTEYKYVRQAKG